MLKPRCSAKRKGKPLKQYFKTCSPFQAEQHLHNMKNIFSVINEYLPPELKKNIKTNIPQATRIDDIRGWVVLIAK